MGVRRGSEGRLAVGSGQGGGDFELDGGYVRFVGRALAAERLAGHLGGNLEGAGNLGQGHFGHFAIPEALEEALGGGAQILGGAPFLLAELGGAADPIGGVLALGGGLGLQALLEQAGVERVDALGPTVPGGPLFDGVGTFVQAFGDGLERAVVAELEEREKSAESARGFARGRREGSR